MALSDKSKWNAPGFTGKGQTGQAPAGPGQQPPPGEPTGGELTSHQQRMQGARHPANLNQPNTVEPKGTETSAADRGKLGQKEEKLDKEQQKQQETEQGQFQAQVQQVASKIGTFGFMLQEKVNQFLTSGAKNLGMNDMSQGLFDPKTGEYKITDVAERNVDPVARQKLEEQKRLKEAMSPFTEDIGGKTYAKSFQDVVSDMFAKDPQTASYINQALDTLDSLNKSGRGDSPEARAAMEQIAAMDHTGDISGIFRAKQQYERMMGIPGDETNLKWYGDKGDTGYTALELSQLGADKIKSEVENSLNFSSGLFGGDFESSLQRLFDKESSDIKESNRKKEAIRNQMSAGFKSFVDEAGGQFAEARQKYEDSFSTLGKSIVDELQKSGKTQEAQMWAEAIQGGNFSTTLFNMMNDPDSGMSAEQRQMITKFIGKAGEQAGGQLFSWLNSLQQTGSFTVTTKDSQGKDKDVQISPDAQQQLQILSVMNSNKSPEDKQTELKKIVSDMAGPEGVVKQTVGSIVQKALSDAKMTGNTEAGLETLKTSLVRSMQSFAGSFTEDIVRQQLGIQDDAWNKMTPEQKQQLVTQTLQQNPELLKGKMTELTSKANAIKQKFDQSIATAKKNLAERDASINAEATFDNKGELVGGRLKEIKDKVQGFTTGMVQDLSSNVFSSFSEGHDRYLKGLRANPIIFDAIKNGRIDSGELEDLATAYSYRDALKSIQSQSPELYNILASRMAGKATTIQALDPKNITKMATDSANAGNTGILRNTLELIGGFLKEMRSGKGDELMQQYLAKVRSMPPTDPKADPKSLPWQASLRLKLEQADMNLKAINEGVEKAKQAKAENAQLTMNMDNMLSKIDTGIFSPDQVMKFALEMGKNTEKGVDKYGYELTKFTPTGPEYKTLGLNPDMMKTLGLNAEDIQQVKGVPYVKMGDGRYQPLDEAILTGIETKFDIPTQVGDVDYGTASQGFVKETGTNIEGIKEQVNPKTGVPVSVETRIRERVDKQPPPKPGTKMQVYTVPNIYNSTRMTIAVPAGTDINKYLNEIGATEFVDASRIKETTKEAVDAKTFKSLADAVAGSPLIGKPMAALFNFLARQANPKMEVPEFKTWATMTQAEKDAIEPEFRPDDPNTPMPNVKNIGVGVSGDVSREVEEGTKQERERREREKKERETKERLAARANTRNMRPE